MSQIDYKNTHGLQAEALEGRKLGFAGKQIIHPSQIAHVQARKCWALGAGYELPVLHHASPDTAHHCLAEAPARPVAAPMTCLACHAPGVQEAFSPDPHDVEEARELVAAFEEHQRHGRGAFTFRSGLVGACLWKRWGVHVAAACAHAFQASQAGPAHVACEYCPVIPDVCLKGQDD